MPRLRIECGDYVFGGLLLTELAPKTCSWFLDQLPLRAPVIHARWSGEAVWMPLGDLESGLTTENHTIHPSRGDVLFYPGGVSEAEILLVYGSAIFSSRAGKLAGNHFLTIDSGADLLAELGSEVLWEGARQIEFTVSDRTGPV